MTIDKNKIITITTSLLTGTFILVIGIILGSVYFTRLDFVFVETNYTIERVEMIPCNLSCLDARNEGYLEGVAECEMHEAYITGVDGRIRSYVDNNEGFYSSDGVMCLQTGGRTTEQIVNTFFHELMHRNIAEYSYEHFCGVQG
jgi:hypothetical protein